jgi:hypothetical protein
VSEVHRLGVETKKQAITEQFVGRVLAHSVIDSDGAWPHRAVRSELERLRSEEVERGLQIERRNMRGVYSKAMYEGGNQEREFASQYRGWAKIAVEWPRTHKLLLAIADDWDADATHEDVRAAQRKMRNHCVAVVMRDR